MEANAPEKLYIISDEEGVILSLDNATDSRGDRYDFVDEAVFPFEDGTFEYTRTDAFIEKACEWIFNQANIYTKLTVDSHDGSVYADFYADKMVEDFRNFIKGE